MDAEVANYLPDALMVNVPAIDQQHAELFARLAHLKTVCIEANCLPSTEADALIEALNVHYATEESFAKQASLDFSIHAEKHSRMLNGIVKTLNQARDGHMDIFSLIRYVEYWFERHITEEDKHLGQQLQAHLGGRAEIGQS